MTPGGIKVTERTSLIRHRSWTTAEVLAVLRMGLLEFSTTERAREVSHCREATPQLKARIERLSGVSQFDSFLTWTDSNSPLWHDFTWRECMALRYAQPDAKAVELLPKEWLKRLESAAEKTPCRGGKTKLKDAALLRLVRATVSGIDFSMGRPVLATEYLRARRAGESEVRKLSECSIWQTAVFRKARDLVIADQSSPEATYYRANFLHYLHIPRHHPDEITGQLLYWLMLYQDIFNAPPRERVPNPLRSRWPPILDLEGELCDADFRAIQAAYLAQLRFPPEFFRTLIEIYVQDRFAWLSREREPARHTVFWVAWLLSEIWPDTCREYFEWVDLFRRNTLGRARELFSEGCSPATRHAAIRPFQDAVLGDVLLNCMLHYEALDGRRYIDPPELRRGPRPRGDRAKTIEWAVRAFRHFHPHGGPRPVRAVLHAGRDLSPALGRVVDAIEGRGVFDFLAPLLSALFKSRPPLSPQALKSTYHKHLRSGHRSGRVSAS